MTKEEKKEYFKNYRENNKEKLKEYKKKYRENNKEKLKKKGRVYNENNKEKRKLRNKKYREKNKEQIRIKDKIRNKNYREKLNKDRKLKRGNDPFYKFSCKIRKDITNIFKKNGYTKNSRTKEILGCSFEEFKIYIESKFESWMNWENRGLFNGEINYGWDIDHIIPLSTAKTKEDLIKLNHYTNLQPLCSKINRYIKKDNLFL